MDQDTYCSLPFLLDLLHLERALQREKEKGECGAEQRGEKGELTARVQGSTSYLFGKCTERISSGTRESRGARGLTSSEQGSGREEEERHVRLL